MLQLKAATTALLLCYEGGTHQHGGAQIKLLRQLGDIDVHGDQVLLVVLLHLADYVSQPLKLALGPCHPDEVDLRTTETRGWVTARIRES